MKPLFDSPGIVVGRKGTLGNPIYSEGKFWAIDTTYAVIARSEVDIKWLYYNFLNFDLTSLNEATGVPSINRDYLYKVEFQVFPLAEQHKIAEILTAVDEAIEQSVALIEKYQRVKQGLMQDLLTRGVDENGQLRPTREQVPHLYRQTELGWLPKTWGTTELAKVATVKRGKFTPRPRNDPKYYGGVHPFIQTGEVAAANGRKISNHTQTLNELGSIVSREFPEGTIVVTIAANIGETAILAIPMYLPDSLVGIVIDRQYCVRYVEMVIRSNKGRFNATAPQSAQKNINLSDLRPMIIALPKRAEQDLIANIYDSTENILITKEKELAKLLRIKQGLMQDLLTGRVRVKDLLHQ